MSILKSTEDFILAEPIKDETDAGGVYLPETVKDKPAKARVISGADFDPGDIVVFKRWNGTTIKDNGKEVVFIAIEDIVGYYD